MRLLKFIILLAVGMLIFSNAALGQLRFTYSGSQNISFKSVNYLLPRLVDSNIQIETKLEGNGLDMPFVFSGVITNLEDRTVEISSAILRLELQGQTEQEKQILGQNYWAPRVIKLLQKPQSSQPIELLPNGKLEFSIKTDDLLWGQQLLSVYPQSKFTKIIEEGKYDLRILLTVKDSKNLLSSKPIQLDYKKKKAKISKAENTCGQCNPKLNSERPTLYIEMAEASEKPDEPESARDKNDPASYRVFRLYNNTRWTIILYASGGDLAKDDLGMFWEFIDEDRNVTSNRICRACSRAFIKAGSSVRFSLDEKRVLDNYAFRITYSYQWEEGDSLGKEPEHNVYFYNPSYVKKKSVHGETHSEKPLPRNYIQE